MLYSQDLSDFKWKNRVVIFTDSDQKFSKAKPAMLAFKSQEKEVEERALLLLLYAQGSFYDDNGALLSLQSERLIKPSFEGVILLGKDGGVKFKEPYPVKAETIFNLVDSMPMRRAEMKY